MAIETNLHITEYIYLTFNLKTGKYYPHRKQNNSLSAIFISNQTIRHQ